jgi:DNA-directed RNA polymerase subunit RPC12/RpoP
MGLRCTKCGNQSRFEVRRPAIMRFAVYPDDRNPGEMREEKLPLGWEVQPDGEYVCRACGSQQVTRNGAGGG